MGTRQSCSKACVNCTTDCARSAPGGLDDLDDEGRGGDPAGAIFEETLEDLNTLDRHLLLFCATSNLAAVRWLLHLGGRLDARDANGTTCLHVACRAGALSVVKEVMKSELAATDHAGWTPLHIAVLMGRREVVVWLLQAGAPTHKRNGKGQLPGELCADNGTFEVLRSYELHVKQGSGKPWHVANDAGQVEDIIGSRLQYEPFFVPRQALIQIERHRKEFHRIGTAMFNRQPGYGLAFLVATGAIRDYPVDMSTFLRRSKVSTTMVGSFFGEAFSLSHTIRLEFFNSVVFQGTGVVSALVRVFHMLRLPDDLQKINRIVHGVARIWWRQHERMVKDLAFQRTQPQKKALPGDPPQVAEELAGLELKAYLTSSDVLHQLMFSAVLLHWYVHRDGGEPRRQLDVGTWMRLNQGMEVGGTDVPEQVQQQVHAVICHSFIPEMAVAAEREDEAKPGRSVFGSTPCSEGWVQIVGGGFPRPQGITTGSQTTTYHHMSSIFSEVPSSGLLKSPLGNHSRDREAAEVRPRSVRRDDYAWLSLCCSLLFFSASTTGSPYAFVEASRVTVSGVRADSRILTLTGAEAERTGNATVGTVTSLDAAPAPPTPGRVPVPIVLLLPDGRWQELSLAKLELRVQSAADLEMWSLCLSQGG